MTGDGSGSELREHQRLRDMAGRKVRAFVSGVDTEVDGLAVELFTLHPEGYDGPSRADR
jgi:hypothetical protein